MDRAEKDNILHQIFLSDSIGAAKQIRQAKPVLSKQLSNLNKQLIGTRDLLFGQFFAQLNNHLFLQTDKMGQV